MTFCGIDYKCFLLSILAPFVFFPALEDDKPPRMRKVYLRHDIDMRMDRAVAMARVEAEMGVRSTYFVLDTAAYFKEDLSRDVKEILSYGHEVGWHNDAFQAWFLDGMKRPVREFIETPINKLRNYGATVRGTAGHFVAHDIEHLFHNYNIWKLPYKFQSIIPCQQFNLRDFGLEYETYFLERDHYLCDSGNHWNLDPQKVVAMFNNSDNDIMQILIHPQWWE